MLVANALCDLRFLFCVSGELSILNILERKGKGRSTKYVLRVRK